MTLYPAGFSQIEVVDIADFWESGQLTITNTAGTAETVGYVVPEDPTPAEDGSGVLDLDTSLTGTYATGDAVVLSPTVVERYADVVEPNGTDHLRIRVPHGLYDRLTLGIREPDKGEMVSFEEDGTDYMIRDLLGRSPVQDLNSVLITTDPSQTGERVDIDQDGIREYESDGTTVAVSLTQLEGLDFLADTSPLNNITRQVRWLADGTTIVAVGAYEDASFDVLDLVVMPRGTRRPTVGVGAGGTVTSGIGTGLVASGVTTALVGAVRVKAGDLAGGMFDLKLLDGNKTSDWAFGSGTAVIDESGGWQDWTPTLTGWSANPASGIYRYKQTGNTVEVVIRQPSNGTSDSANKSISAPVTAATITNHQWDAPVMAVNSGTALTTPAKAAISSAGTAITFCKDYSANTGGWTSSGDHKIASCYLVYEAA